MARVREIALAAAGDDEFYDELVTFLKAFLTHFGEKNARRYVLFHLASGSTPLDRADRFDARGEWSVARKLEEIAAKYAQRERG